MQYNPLQCGTLEPHPHGSRCPSHGHRFAPLWGKTRASPGPRSQRRGRQDAEPPGGRHRVGGAAQAPGGGGEGPGGGLGPAVGREGGLPEGCGVRIGGSERRPNKHHGRPSMAQWHGSRYKGCPPQGVRGNPLPSRMLAPWPGRAPSMAQFQNQITKSGRITTSHL